MASLSRRLAQFAAGLRYEDLPPAVIDRAKGVTLQTLTSVWIGSQMAQGKQAVKMVVDEEAGVKKGADSPTARSSRSAALHSRDRNYMAGGKWDTFRMLTHPNTAIIPAALIAADPSGASGKAYLTGVAAGYEVMERMAADFIPTLMARGFHSRTGIRHLRCGGGGGEGDRLQRRSDQQRDRDVCEPRSGQSRSGPCGACNCAKGRPVATPCSPFRWRNPATWAARRYRRRRRLLSRVCRKQPRHSYPQLHGRYEDESREDHREPGQGLDVPRDALSHLLHGGLQHRAHRRLGGDLQGARHSLRGCRSRGVRRELHRDPVSESRFPRATRGWAGAPRRNHVLHRLRCGEAGLSRVGAVAIWNTKEDPPEVLELMQRVKLIPAHQMTLFGPRITIFRRTERAIRSRAPAASSCSLRHAGERPGRRASRAADPGIAVWNDHRRLSRA